MEIAMNREPCTEPHLEVKWHSISEAGKSKLQRTQLVMTWVAIASAHSRLSN